MPEFVTKPPRVLAEQWDGTLEGAIKIGDFINTQFAPGDINVESVFSWRPRIMQSLLKTGHLQYPIHKDWWVVVMGDSTLRGMDDREFQEKYKAVKK